MKKIKEIIYDSIIIFVGTFVYITGPVLGVLIGFKLFKFLIDFMDKF